MKIRSRFAFHRNLEVLCFLWKTKVRKLKMPLDELNEWFSTCVLTCFEHPNLNCPWPKRRMWPICIKRMRQRDVWKQPFKFRVNKKTWISFNAWCEVATGHINAQSVFTIKMTRPLMKICDVATAHKQRGFGIHRYQWKGSFFVTLHICLCRNSKSLGKKHPKLFLNYPIRRHLWNSSQP